ncbi:heterokaryon incompatibility protein-domain-containing protein [Aspergillus navahoensis]
MGVQWSSLLNRLSAGSPDALEDEPSGSLNYFWEAIYHWVVDPEYEEYFPAATEPHHDNSSTGHNDPDVPLGPREAPQRPWENKFKTVRKWIEGPETHDPDLAYSSSNDVDKRHRERSRTVDGCQIPSRQFDTHSSRVRQASEPLGGPYELASLFTQNKRPRAASTTMGDHYLSPDIMSPVGSLTDGPTSLSIRETSVSHSTDKQPTLRPLYPSPDQIPDLQKWSKEIPPGVHSCSCCRLLFFDAKAMAPAIEHTSRILSQEEIFEAAAGGCTLFLWLQRAIQRPEGNDPEGRHFLLSLVSKDQESFDISTFNFASNNQDEFDHRSHGDLGVYADPDNPAAKYISGRPLLTAVGSKDSVRRSRKWLADCHQSPAHTACRGSGRAHLPERVIRIEGERIYLFEPDGYVPGKYAVLSYSWGGGLPYRTLKENRKSHRRSIPFDKLTKTVQDAITTSSDLGLKYIWVDCLCVIQDDKKDLIKQIKNLPDIFQGAYVTISAASASSSSQGFLYDRKPDIVRVPYMLPDGNLGALNLFQETSADPEPIHTRAWTLQEHIHSCRILEYGSQQLRRICRGPLDGDTYARTTLRKFDPAKFDKGIWGHAPSPREVLLNYWRPLVEHYTQRKLTYPTDRPLAILGIAREYSKVMGSEYVEGLWKKHLYEDLLWYRHAPEKLQSRYTEHIAPSWSWLSLDGVTIRWLNPESDLAPDQFEINVDRLSDRWLGNVAGDDTRVLKATGFLRKALWMQETQFLLPRSECLDAPIAIIIADAEEPRVSSQEGIVVECLTVLRSPVTNVGLVLVQSSQVRNEYRRVGLFRSLQDPKTDQKATAVENWRRTETRRTINII